MKNTHNHKYVFQTIPLGIMSAYTATTSETVSLRSSSIKEVVATTTTLLDITTIQLFGAPHEWMIQPEWEKWETAR